MRPHKSGHSEGDGNGRGRSSLCVDGPVAEGFVAEGDRLDREAGSYWFVPFSGAASLDLVCNMER
jgi:hypothetical protein